MRYLHVWTREKKKNKRFELVHKKAIAGFSAVRTPRDKRTEVQYLFVAEGYAGGLTPLLEVDGRPIRD